MASSALRRLFAVLLFVRAAGCSEAIPEAPRCTDGRSRCVAQVSLGAHFGCALLRDRTVWCWGRNDEAQLGYPTTDLCPEELANGQTRAVACHAFPFQVVGLDRATAVAAGGAFACALRDDGTVRCWGSNSAGQLGNGLTLPSAAPTTVNGLSGVTALAAGARHACALVGTRVFCWGANDRGQLAQPNTSRTCEAGGESVPCETVPKLVQTLDDVVAITAGDAHTCARTGDGLVFCWGDNRDGQLGSGRITTAPSPYPLAVLDGELPIERVREVSAGGAFTCARDEEGAVWCWGRNGAGQLGASLSGGAPASCAGPCSARPVRVPRLASRPRPQDAGTLGTMLEPLTDAAVDAPPPARDADLDAGGGDRDVAAPEDVVEPVEDTGVHAPSTVPRGIAAGGTFACAPLEDGTVRCWGDDALGQLGDGQRGRDPQGPVMVIATPGAAATNPLQRVASVAGGADVACALLTDGSLRCWGSNRSGALGVGGTAVQAGPVPVSW